MRVALVSLGTAVTTFAVVANAFLQKKQFYPSVVYLTKSNPSMAVLYAQVFVFVVLLGKAFRKIFFGQLRPAEIEHLIERFWYVITETCLAFTVFRDDFSPRFVALFTFLLFMKAFHWLVEDRIDYMERSPVITFKFHIRALSLLVILGTLDSCLVQHAFQTTLASGASVQLVFGFEYAVLLTSVVGILAKYALHTIDTRLEHPWESKTVYLLYNELFTGFVKCTMYIVFVLVMVKIHTFPLFAIRPMYLAVKSFKKSLSDVILSRRAISYMNTRFPDATAAELLELDNTCIICREEMLSGKKLPCAHIFHVHCLRSWFQRQQSCPTCRLDVIASASQLPAQTPAQAAAAAQPAVPPQPAQPGVMIPPFIPPGMFMPPPPPVDPSLPPAAGTSATSAVSTADQIPSMFGMPPGMAPPGMPPMPPMFGSSPPFMMPPFGMFPPPPPPPPPAFLGAPFGAGLAHLSGNLDSLTTDQLREMEGQERENVLARVELLRNVHTLLDSVILQLNQYTQVITALNSVPVQPTTSGAAANGNTASTPVSMETQVTDPIGAVFEEPLSKIPTDEPSLAEESVEEISSSSILSDSLEDEVRRRRLERFASVTMATDITTETTVTMEANITTETTVTMATVASDEQTDETSE